MHIRIINRSTSIQNVRRVIRRFSKKVFEDVEEALKVINSGNKILVGGFGLCGIPLESLENLSRQNINNLTLVSNDAGTSDIGIGVLIRNNQVKRMVCSFIGENRYLQQKYLDGGIELELIPQGTLAEKIRAAGAGIPAFYTSTGVGTVIQKGGYPIKLGQQQELTKLKESRIFFNKEYLLEESIVGDFALIKGYRADIHGNVQFNKTAMNFNMEMGKAGKRTIVEAEEIVEVLSPQQIQLPSIYVERVFKNKNKRKYYQKLKTEDEEINVEEKRIKIVKRAIEEIQSGMFVNLGIGIPTLIANFIDNSLDVTIHSENGVLGVGKYPQRGLTDPDLINAGKETITLKKGGSYFSSSESFGIVRSGKLHIAFLGALQVSEKGDLSNWIVPNKMINGMGGAMDLVSSQSKVIVLMNHVNKNNQSKIVKECDYQLTGIKCVDKIITDLAVFEFMHGQLVLTEISQGVSLEQVRQQTGCDFQTSLLLKQF